MTDDLQELFARLKAQAPDPQSQPQIDAARPSPSIWAHPQQTSAEYYPPTVSSPIFSPPIHTPNPIHSSRIISPVQPGSIASTPGAMEQTRTNNLLNLLKFNNTPTSQVHGGPMAGLQNISASRSGSGQFSGDARPVSAQDLVASMQRNASGSTESRASLAGVGNGDVKSPIPVGPNNQQDFLLNLLKRPSAVQAPSLSTIPSSVVPTFPDAGKDALQSEAPTVPESQSPVHVEQQSDSKAPLDDPAKASLAFDPPQPTKASMFSYINPFEQLHTSSPLNRGSKPPPNKDANETEQVDSSVDTTRIETKSKSVSKTLENVGETVDKQVEKALAAAEVALAKESPADSGEKTEDVDSNWESAEDSANEKKDDFKVTIYNFPMKPFVSIQIKPIVQPATPFRADNVMVIASLKKEFDQIDRSLVTASQAHIVYAQPATKKENKGFRIIRQDTGDHKSVFRTDSERIFSVQVCSSSDASNDMESVLGTGIDGTIFWTSLSKSRADMFSEDDAEALGFVMAPVLTPEESASGSPVKTRARLSHRHPNMFALARGKQIHIVAPQSVREKPYFNASTRRVDSEKYLADHGLRIHTLKAGKDFCFSEDDSLIASLDKSGRVKFWDIRPLVEQAQISVSRAHEPIELREPLIQFSAVASGMRPDEKPSVSSILLLDKERPHTKGVALRYMLIGFKQNHILQLWDLGLAKAVQEVRLPHEKDSDAICSINYHPKTGVLAVGHPTRNSIYFVHLSAPKYNVPFMTQARYVEMLARDDPALPRPESTAIMSGLRELSLDRVGQLRSVDMLKTPVENAAEKGAADETLFELYIMHSKGVVGIGIKRADLGWDADGRMQHSVDAVESGAIECSELKVTPPKDTPPPSESNGASENIPKKSAEKKDSKKSETPKASHKIDILKNEDPQTPVRNGHAASTLTNIPDILSKDGTAQATAPATNPPLMTPESYAMTAQKSKPTTKNSNQISNTVQAIVENQGRASDGKTQANATPLQQAPADIERHFEQLYQRLETDKRVSEAAAGAKQDAILRLVSSTLTDNVEQTLHRIVNKSIVDHVIPRLSDDVSSLASKALSDLVPKHVEAAVKKELEKAISIAVPNALRDAQIHRAIGEAASQQVTTSLQPMLAILQKSITGATTQAVDRAVTDAEARTARQLQQMEISRQQERTQIQELSETVRQLSSTLQQMAEDQAAMRQHLASSRTSAAVESTTPVGHAASTASVPTVPQLSVEEQEIEDITKTLTAGQYQDATMQWLQSPRQAELFERLFIRVNPQYLHQVTPLVALSVSAAVTSSFDTFVVQRLDWLQIGLAQINLADPDIRDVAPQILAVLSQRLQGVYMNVSEATPNSPVLKKIVQLNRQVTELRRVVD